MAFQVVAVYVFSEMESIEKSTCVDNFAPMVNSELRDLMLECYSQGLTKAGIKEKADIYFEPCKLAEPCKVMYGKTNTLDEAGEKLEQFTNTHNFTRCERSYLMCCGFILTSKSKRIGKTNKQRVKCNIVRNFTKVMMKKN